MSNITTYENSQQEGIPVECYRFTCNGIQYRYTSRRDNVTLVLKDGNTKVTEVFNADYIERDEIEPGSSGNECEMNITVKMDNPVALLYQGMPPEVVCDVEVIRAHTYDLTKRDIVYKGRVTQVSFENCKCILTVTLENWLTKEIPNGLYQYFCNNILYDKNCRLKQADYTISVFLDKAENLNVYCKDFANYPDGYFDNGKMYFNNQVRSIKKHVGELVVLRYPFSQLPRNDVTVTAGCDRLFKTCVKRFNNSLNFTGFPYCPPTDSEKNPTGTGVYWTDTTAIRRDTDGFMGVIT